MDTERQKKPARIFEPKQAVTVTRAEIERLIAEGQRWRAEMRARTEGLTAFTTRELQLRAK